MEIHVKMSLVPKILPGFTRILFTVQKINLALKVNNKAVVPYISYGVPRASDNALTTVNMMKHVVFSFYNSQPNTLFLCYKIHDINQSKQDLAWRMLL